MAAGLGLWAARRGATSQSSAAAPVFAERGDDPAGGAVPAARDLAPVPARPGLDAPSERRIEDAAEPEAAPPIDPAHARERDWYAEFMRESRARRGALEELAEGLLAGDGPRAQKVALLRALLDSGSADALNWLEHAARTVPDGDGARGESVPFAALGLLGKSAPREPAARATLARLAFESPELHVALRRRSASLYAAHCDVGELSELRRRLYRETNGTITGSALAALDSRASEPEVRRWLAEFDDHPRPTPLED